MEKSKNPLKLKPNEILYQKNDPSEFMYLIKEGTISIFSSGERVSDTELARLRKGQMVGDLHFLEPQPRNATAKAVTDCELIGVPYAMVQQDYNELKPWFKVMLFNLTNQVKQLAKDLKTSQALLSSSGSAEKLDIMILRYLGVLSYAVENYGEYSEGQNNIVTLSLADIRKVGSQVFMISTEKMMDMLHTLAELQYFAWVFDEKGTANKYSIMDLAVLRRTNRFLTRYIDLGKSELLNPSTKEAEFVKGMAWACRKKEADWRGNVMIAAPDAVRFAKQREPFITVDTIDGLIKKGLMIERINAHGILGLIFNKADIEEMAVVWDILARIKSSQVLVK